MKIYIPVDVNVLCIARDPRTRRILDRVWAHNLVPTKGKELLARFLACESGWGDGVSYFAIGTGTDTPLPADSKLKTETARKAVSMPVYRVGNRLQFRAYFPSADCNVFVKEIGMFGHSTASAVADSGEMFNHALLSKDNSGGSPADLTFYVVVVVG